MLENIENTEITIMEENFATASLPLDLIIFGGTNIMLPHEVSIKKLADTGYLKVVHRTGTGEIDVGINKLDILKAIHSLLSPPGNFEADLEKEYFLRNTLEKLYSDNQIKDDYKEKFWQDYEDGKFYRHDEKKIFPPVLLCEWAFLDDADEKYENNLADKIR